MEIGSIVECVKPTLWERIAYLQSKNVSVPKVGKTYTVRGFYENAHIPGRKISLYLEEIHNDKIPVPGITEIVEPSFEMECFKELLPPMDIMSKIERDAKRKLPA